MIYKISLIYFFLFFATTNFLAQKFKEVSISKGITYNYPGNDYQEVGAGVTVLDVNNDGWDDIFQSGGVFPSKLWLNKNGTFIDATELYGLNKFKSYFIQSVIAGDYDNDGYEDLFICNMGELMKMGDGNPPLLLKNINGNYFETVHQSAFNQLGSFPGATWGDYNNDGFIDLYVLNYVHLMSNGFDSIMNRTTYIPKCNENLFFINHEGKYFEEIAKYLNVNDNGCGLVATFTDFDNDNDMDLILLNDFGQWNHLGNKFYKNNYPQLNFSDISDTLNFYKEFYGMGVGIGDYNNDGNLDYYLTNIGQNYFFENKLNTLNEKAKELKIDLSFEKDSLKGTSWSGIFLDIENDGDLDLYVAKGFLNSLEKVIVKDENKLFVNNGKFGFKNVSKQSGINDSLAHRGAATLDFDHDGDLDIVSSVIKMQRGEFSNLNQKIKLFENRSQRKNNWIGIKLVGKDSVNKSCLGCSVSFSNDHSSQIREVDGGSGHGSQSSRIIYFGLKKRKYISNILIQWLGGKTSTIKKLKSNHVYQINQKGEVSILY